MTGYGKLGEIPYDFIRKRLSVAERRRQDFMITKGALSNVLSVCEAEESGEGRHRGDPASAAIDRFKELSDKGFRVSASPIGMSAAFVRSAGMMRGDDLSGIPGFSDPPRPGSQRPSRTLKSLGVSLKVITGDNHLVAATWPADGAGGRRYVTGADMRQLSDGALPACHPTRTCSRR